MTKPPAKPPTTVRFRDSGTGEFTTKSFAVKNPQTTERQHIRLPTPPTKKS